MRNCTLLLTLLMLAASCKKEHQNRWEDQTRMQKVEMHVHAADAYTSKFSDVAATVTLSIQKTDYGTGNTQPVWDTTFTSRPLTAYPVLPQKFVIEKFIAADLQKEKLQVTYSVQYQSKEDSVTTRATEVAKPGELFTFLDVAI